VLVGVQASIGHVRSHHKGAIHARRGQSAQFLAGLTQSSETLSHLQQLTLQFGARRQLHHVDVTTHLCVHTLHATLRTTEAAAEIARVACVRVRARVRVNPSESLALTAINASQRTVAHTGQA
jgi:uncharacterized protein YciW